MLWGLYIEEKKRNPLSDYREGDTALHSAAPLRAQSSYNVERSECGSMELRLPNNEERSPKVASGRKHGAESNNTYIHLSDHSLSKF